MEKPHFTKTELILVNQARGACFKPYNALVSLQIKLGLKGSTKPGGCVIKTCSDKSPLRKAL